MRTMYRIDVMDIEQFNDDFEMMNEPYEVLGYPNGNPEITFVVNANTTEWMFNHYVRMHTNESGEITQWSSEALWFYMETNE